MYQYRAKIVKIIDGDTVDVDIDLGFSVILSKQRIRLYGIDTPKIFQNGAKFVKKLINKDNECVNTIMCSLGHAVEYYGQSKDDIAKSHLLNRIKIDKLNEQ